MTWVIQKKRKFAKKKYVTIRTQQQMSPFFFPSISVIESVLAISSIKTTKTPVKKRKKKDSREEKAHNVFFFSFWF